MAFDPLQRPCPHLATPQELARDPRYRACEAVVGELCRWARRYDGLPDPAFHSERLEATLLGRNTALTPGQLRKAILETGLV